MTFVDWLGAIGVFQILLAYVMNVLGKINSKHMSFILLNLIGSSMACMASILLNYWPFIVLEGVWCMVSVFALIRYKKLI